MKESKFKAISKSDIKTHKSQLTGIYLNLLLKFKKTRGRAVSARETTVHVQGLAIL